MQNETREEAERKLCAEIAQVTGRNAETVDPAKPLSANGIDSMSFLELLLYIRKEWKVDLLAKGISVEQFKSVSALAETIAAETAS